MLNEFILVLFYFFILMYSIILHEVFHGVAALWLGDNTAKYAGRLTANPIKHIDLYWTIILPLIMLITTGFAFGMAKPVPYNPYNLKNQKWGPTFVGIAGPLSNIILATVAALIARILPVLIKSRQDIFDSFRIAIGGRGFGLESWVRFANSIQGSFVNIIFGLLLMIIFWNILIAVFNLIPFPPLDGSKIIYGLFPIKIETMAILEQYGIFFLFLVIILDGSTFNILGKILNFAWSLFFSLANAG